MDRGRAFGTAAVAMALLAAGARYRVAALDGAEIMQRVRDREVSSGHALVKMDLVEANGTVSSRTVEGWAMRGEDGLARTLIVFHAPASVAGTRFLQREAKGREDDRWIYLPALKKVRRIAASEGDKPFMGSDFTYDDLAPREVEEDNHTLLREESFGGRECYVVESRARDPGSSQYGRRVQWVAKDIWVPLKAELYDKRGGLAKVLVVESLEQVQGHWTPMKTTMRSVASGHSTVLTVQKVVYDEKLSDELFTTRTLETGKIQ